MNTHTHDVISDFLDGEAFDAAALGHALADPAGRDLLIDSVVIRYALRAEEPAPVAVPRPQSRRRLFLTAAALLIALASGYQVGNRLAQPSTDAPPQPTRFVDDASWQAVAPENNQ